MGLRSIVGVAMAATEWGTREWQNDHFPKDQLDSIGDTWGIRWRGMDKMRHRSYLKLIKDDLRDSRPLKILDIGCALCDFTEKAWNLNRNNRFWGMDLSDNAIAWVTEKFPMFHFKTGAIPDMPFDVDFDFVFCLEVLCYVDAEGRKKTIKNIHNVLAPSGKLMFSGVLDGGRQYHTEQEVVELFRNDFEIREISFNHWSLYRTVIENPLNNVDSALTSTLRILQMSNEECQEWRSSKRSGIKINFVTTLRLANPVSIWVIHALSKSIKLIIGSRQLAVIANWTSQVTRGPKMADEIIVIAVKN